MAFTAQSLSEAREYVGRAENKITKLREKTEEAIGNGIEVLEVSGTAFAFGYANGRWGEDGEITFFHAPADLLLGGGLAVLGMFGGLGKYRDHGVNIGAGALASYVTRTGYELGRAAADDDSDDDDKPVAKLPANNKKAAARMNGHAASVGWDGQTYTVHEEAA